MPSYQQIKIPTLAELIPFQCPYCGGRCIRMGRDRKGRPRVVCKVCGCTHLVKTKPSVWYDLRLAPEKVIRFAEAIQAGQSLRQASKTAGCTTVTGLRLLKRLKAHRVCQTCGKPVETRQQRGRWVYCSEACSPWPSRKGWRKARHERSVKQ